MANCSITGGTQKRTDVISFSSYQMKKKQQASVAQPSSDDQDDEKPHEECGVFAICAKDNSVHVAQTIYQGLMMLQHCGQEAAGLSVVDANKRIYTYKDKGLVVQALPIEILAKLWGNVGIGHCRYGTAGSGEVKNAQPFHYETTQCSFP